MDHRKLFWGKSPKNRIFPDNYWPLLFYLDYILKKAGFTSNYLGSVIKNKRDIESVVN